MGNKIRIVFSLAVLSILVIVYAGSRYAASAPFGQTNLPLITARYSYINNKNIASAKQNSLVLGQTVSQVKSLPILLYHGVTESGQDEYDISWEQFNQQLTALKNAGYQTITTKDLPGFFAGRPLPPKSFMLTFDDGRKDSYYPVDPILQALDYQAVIFVIANRYDQNYDPYHLTKSEINKMINSGRWDIQAHGYQAHSNIIVDNLGNQGPWLTNRIWLNELNRLETTAEYQQRISQDLLASKQLIEDNFPLKITSYAFPFGKNGNDSLNLITAPDIIFSEISHLFQYSFSQTSNLNDQANLPNVDPLHLNRFIVNKNWSGQELVNYLDRISEKSSEYIDNFDSDNGWIDDWGQHQVDQNNLTITANPSGSSAQIRLLGTQTLNSNFSFSFVADPSQSESLSIVYGQSDNYYGCLFTRNRVSYIENNGNTKTTGFTYRANLNYLFRPNSQFGITVTLGQVICQGNGHLLLKTQVVNTAKTGLVGFHIWNSSRPPQLVVSNLSLSN